MSLQAYLAFVAACVALALLPGPIVTLVIANSRLFGRSLMRWISPTCAVGGPF